MPNYEARELYVSIVKDLFSSKLLDIGLYGVNQDKVSFPILASYYLKDRSQTLCISTVMFKSVSQCHGFLSRKTGPVSRQAFHITVNFWGNAGCPQIQTHIAGDIVSIPASQGEKVAYLLAKRVQRPPFFSAADDTFVSNYGW
jgi:hypothetical protein